jgi:hypothetical protein
MEFNDLSENLHYLVNAANYDNTRGDQLYILIIKPSVNEFEIRLILLKNH